MENKKVKPNIREKALAYGMAYPFDVELVMMILGSGTKGVPVEILARRIIACLDKSNEDEFVDNLMAIPGIGESKALAIASALELGKRRCCHIGAHIRHPDDVVPFVRNYAISQKEHFLAITLNGGHDIIKIHVVSVGTLNQTLIHPREVFREAIQENAAAIIFCHNHPSGNVEPSEEDIAATKNLVAVSKILGIPVLDHIIIEKEKYYSFMAHGIIAESE